MKITIIYDNTGWKKDLIADWGFSCLVEAHDRAILFDAGGNGKILLDNMQKLGINARSITDIFISHGHFDHIGGLSAFLNENNEVTLYAPLSFRGVKNVKQLVYVSKPARLADGIYSTGELEHIEQIMAIETDKGLVLIAGCSHPDMENIFRSAGQFGSIYGIAGGLHGFDRFDMFSSLGLICPTHCTRHTDEIKRRYPEKYIQGGAGQTLFI